MHDSIKYKTHWTIRKYLDDQAFADDTPYDIAEIDGNLLLNAGITLALQLVIGAGGTTFANANARIGVGDSSTAEAATQTGLVAATNKTYQAAAATYPSVAAQTLTAQAAFGSAAANYAWAEFTLDNGVTSLNRKVSAQGTKTAGQTWTVTMTITLS
jgi:hypothetical protein